MAKIGRFLLLSGLIILAPLMPANAQGDDVATIEDAVLTMRAGDNIWRDNGQGEVSVIISIPMQMAFVYRDGRLIGASTVSTGRPGKSTPTGEFRVLEKRVFHRSNIYSNAPMPYMQRLTWTGIAMHAGHLPGYPASHGCIRFPTSFAKQLFAITRTGALVEVTNQRIDLPSTLRFRAPPPAPAPLPPILTVSADALNGERYNAVTLKTAMAAAPGETVYGPARPVIQKLPNQRD